MLAFFLAEIESISSLEARRQRLDVLLESKWSPASGQERLDSMTPGLPALCLCVNGSEKGPGIRGHWGPKLAWPLKPEEAA